MFNFMCDLYLFLIRVKVGVLSKNENRKKRRVEFLKAKLKTTVYFYYCSFRLFQLNYNKLENFLLFFN